MDTLNRQAQEFALQGKLSPRKVRNLIVLKKMVDRLATKTYISESEVEELAELYGEAPDIITWGDYFQAEVATDHWQKDDAEFETLMQTITFDLIAAILIFDKKKREFFEIVRANQQEAMQKDKHKITEEDKEHVHMGILLDYFLQMGLSAANLTDQDFDYFEQFASKKAI